MQKILGKSLGEWTKEYPILKDIVDLKEVCYINDAICNEINHVITPLLSLADIKDASDRLERFAPYFMKVFPETVATKGIIESKLVPINNMQTYLSEVAERDLFGQLYLKQDSHLPISGSVKARGGIYEVLTIAEKIAVEAGLLTYEDDYSKLDSNQFRKLFSGYSISVGSTGNLGLSIGIMSAKLGFDVTVHMSADAKQWKKDMLRAKGAKVVEYEDDYSKAVAEGRRQCEGNPKAHFVDDENSQLLFLGYAVSALRLQKQLEAQNIVVDDTHPLFLYLPCGVGGAPGGITFGMRTVFGTNAHCFMVEPTHSPAMMLGLVTKQHEKVSAQDFGIDNRTAADGLAVGRPSGFVGKTLEHEISGTMTVEDNKLYKYLYELATREGIYLEPSALAGFKGYIDLCTQQNALTYLEENGVMPYMKQSTHIVWATGGGMVPQDVMEDFFATGKQLIIDNAAK